MCVTELNVSVLPCQHRWYHLLRPCNPNTNLENCSSRLGIEGWEIRCDFCPYCSDWNIDATKFRLLGNDRTPSIGGLSRHGSISLCAVRHENRRNSSRSSISTGLPLASIDSSSNLSMMAVTGEKNRALNARLDAYLSTRPDRISSIDSTASRSDSEEDLPPSPTDTGSTYEPSVSSSSLFSRGWRKSKRLSTTIFK